jgi:N-carbamoylputrescine amidase
MFGALAVKHGATIVLPTFERAEDGHYYNTAVVVGPDGELVTGHYLGKGYDRFRKCHVPSVDNPPDTVAWEDHYFTPGRAFPVFDTPKVRIGVLICFDRWFPEAWRMLTFEGAELVVVPMVAWGFVEGPYLPMLQSRAVENGLFVVSCNRSAFEELDGVAMPNFGRSLVLAPDGVVVASADPDAGQVAIAATLDLTDIDRQRDKLPLLRYRREDLYGKPESWS